MTTKFFANCTKTLSTLEGQAAQDFIAAIACDKRSGINEAEKNSFIRDAKIVSSGKAIFAREGAPKEIEVDFLGKVETYTLYNGTGEYPYDCMAKDKHPDSPCYWCVSSGGWVQGRKLFKTSDGIYKHVMRVWE